MMAPDKTTFDQHWHLDKRVPLALIFTLMVQTAGLVWWASSISERVNALERVRDVAAPQADRLTKVEVRLEGVQAGIEEIKRLVRREAP